MVKVRSKSENSRFCTECGFKKRGANHYDGEHHNRGKKGRCEIRS